MIRRFDSRSCRPNLVPARFQISKIALQSRVSSLAWLKTSGGEKPCRASKRGLTYSLVCQVAPGESMAHHPTTHCAVCQRPCELESCVIDERGHAVHPKCYHKSLSSSVHVRNKYDEVEDLLQQARELRDVADQLIKKSDRLIEAYKQLTGQDKRPRID